MNRSRYRTPIPAPELRTTAARLLAIAALSLMIPACSPGENPDGPDSDDPGAELPTASGGTGCTPAPPAPIGTLVTRAEWQAAVHPNCFEDLDRLAHWTGGTKPLGDTESPAKHFAPVTTGQIRSGSVVVIAHGWAPSYRKAVDSAGGDILWWSANAFNPTTKAWTSDWAWVPTKGTAEPIAISDTGLFQQAVAHDSSATVLGYSWIDDSATLEDSIVDLDLVYRSEAYTNVNGLRLAAALEQALAPEFWSGSGNSLHIVGHSHGSKVATTATLALQSRGKQVDHLTILDSPEDEDTLLANGANLLGFYLDRIATRDGSGSGDASGAFVDNYVSYFGAGFDGSANADRVVDVILNPAVYSCTDPGDRHAYSAEWYGGAAVGAAAAGLPPVGLAWPPSQTPDQPALDQTWPGGYTEKAQWQLQASSASSLGCESTAEICTYDSPTATVQTISSYGNVSGSPADGLVFSAGSGPGSTVSSFRGSTSFGSTQYGIAFDLQWTSPKPGDYLVITGSTADDGYEVLLVMDGRSAISGRNPVAMNTYVIDSLEFDIYYIPAEGNSAGQVTIDQFRAVTITC